jgi:hypothetical protein
MNQSADETNWRQSRSQQRIQRLSSGPTTTTPEDIGWLLLAAIGAGILGFSPIRVAGEFARAWPDLQALSGSYVQLLFWAMLGAYLLVLFILHAGAGWFVMAGSWRRTRWGFSMADAQAEAARAADSDA